MNYVNENFIHCSHIANIEYLDPEKFNSNDYIKSSEVERVKRFTAAPLRVCAYLYNGKDLPTPEARLGTNIYKGTATLLYDVKKDPAKLKPEARKLALKLYPSSFKLINDEMVYDRSHNAPTESGAYASLLEYLILHKGFSGYVDYERGVMVSFKKLKVEKIN